MPYLSKQAISTYFRTECKRQLRLTLSPDNQRFAHERNDLGMPPKQPARPGLEQLAQAGEEWERKVLQDLVVVFGENRVCGDQRDDSRGMPKFYATSLSNIINHVTPPCFIVEAQYEITSSFEDALGIQQYRDDFSLNYAEVRPDIIQVLPSGHSNKYVLPSGEVDELPQADERIQLRVIDIKLTSEPSPGYFAEVAYYAMVLAGWIIDNRLQDRFVVIPEPAIWPGSHDASSLITTYQESIQESIPISFTSLLGALENDLERVPFEVFVFRLRRLFRVELLEVLSTPWQNLDWHVDNRCKGCDFLGYPWGQQSGHPYHCFPMAQVQEHLSRVAFVSRGATSALRTRGINSVSNLARLNSDAPEFDSHHILRATRSVIVGRADALQNQQSTIPMNSGTSAVMPRWTDLHIYLSTDFDLSSAITVNFGIKAFWLDPARPSDTSPRNYQNWGPEVFIVDQKDVMDEQRELLAFLEKIENILSDARNRNNQTTVQFYLWDSLQYEHLTRVIGRHLEAILNHQSLQHLAWLFPPEELLENPRLTTRRSPITIVRDVVRAVLAAPVPHYYSLLQVARAYHDNQLPPSIATFSIHPLFEDPLSDQIPSERAHEIWTRSIAQNRYWRTQMRILEETVKKKLSALETVTKRLESDLGPALDYVAPVINVITPPQRANRLSFDSQLWYAFSKLDAALGELKIHQIRAMPPYEREARFHSARLSYQVLADDAQQVLARLNLPQEPGRRVYKMRETSKEVKFREGDIGCALSPEADPGFLDRKWNTEVGNQLQVPSWAEWSPMETFTQVTVVAIDRENGFIVLDPNTRFPTILDDLERAEIEDFTQDVVLDPVYHDFFTKKLLTALGAIGNPQIAKDEPLVRRAIGQIRSRGSRRTAHTPAADFLWNAITMHQTEIRRVLDPTKQALEANGLGLNATQWAAWEGALTQRLQLIWGPPGTGKSRTARAIVLGAALNAQQDNRALRLLVTAFTYTAMDNVLLKVYDDIVSTQLFDTHPSVYRLRSYLRRAHEPSVPSQIDVALNRADPSQEVLDLRAKLTNNENEIVIVGATSEQVHNLLIVDDNPAQEELFDLILIDEASQMDVAHATLVLCSLACGGSVILAGDPKQLPPIHQAKPPLNLEQMVGPIYTFCRDFHQVPHVMLDENYRSNAAIVEFSRNAGYEETLKSYSPNLQLHCLDSLPEQCPPSWPSVLPWTPEWSELLEPSVPVVCYVYPDSHSSQWNKFEADAVAALVFLLRHLVGRDLENERIPPAGAIRERNDAFCSDEEFWGKVIGVVTPHRAQQGLVIGRLIEIFPNTDQALIRDAVDTVERFQGQERDVIIATFALGDPDSIRDEDEFLMSLNRFNVMSSRARAKLIVIVSQQVVDHLSDDFATLNESTLLKVYAESFCNQNRPMTLCHFESGQIREIDGTFKYRVNLP